MDDVVKVLHVVFRTLHFIFQGILTFAETSSVAVGIGLLVLAALVRTYHRRRTFYAGLDTASDWEPRYGDIVRARVADFALRWGFGLAVFFGLMVLWNWWLPPMFDAVLGFFVRLTG